MTRVFFNSFVKKKLREGKVLSYNSLLPVYDKIPNYLIGDPAYPLTPYCIKEYQSRKSNEEVLFNNMLLSARNPIECALYCIVLYIILYSWLIKIKNKKKNVEC